MGIVIGFAPWIIYWVLVGNVPFEAAVLVALVVAIATYVIGRINSSPGLFLETGAVATFLVLTVLTFTLDQQFMERWLQPLSNAGIFVVALVSVLINKPFVREFAAAGLPPDVVKTDLFDQITTRLTWIWVAAFAGMTVSSAIPPIVQGDATILDTGDPLSVVCYWVIPFVLLAAAALASRILPDRWTAGFADVARKTTFVAFTEAEIDQLLFLATERANREVGPGQEAYAVRLGGKGLPLTGDESRLAWDMSYKVRDKKH